jgi:carboxyl-terminal processing protease
MEVLAYALREAGTPLVGVTTAGALLAGRGFMLGDGSLLEIAVLDVRLDGERIEGVGIAPTVEVPFDIRHAAGKDPQLDAALAELLTS